MRFERHSSDGRAIVVFDGRLNEHSELDPLADALRDAGPFIDFDLGGVISVNSVGTRTWILFLRRLDGKRVHFQNCSPPFVNQMAMISGFSHNAVIDSFQVTYGCERCDTERSVLWTAGKEFAGGGWIAEPEVRCEGCRGIMEMIDPRATISEIVALRGDP